MASADDDPGGDEHTLLPVLHRLADQRYDAARAEVARLRAEHGDEGPDQLADRLIRRYAKELALGGAVAGGAAASPVAGVAVAAASAGADATYSTGRLSELIMGIGLLYGHERTTTEDRGAAIATVMGIADGAAVGMSSLAARAGARGGARLLRRLPRRAPAPGAGAGSRALARVSRGTGPWSAAALIPYGIGAGVGAAGNAMLARAVGRAAKDYFGTRAGSAGDPGADPSAPAGAGTGDHVADRDVVVEILDDGSELLDADVPTESEPVDVVDAEIVEAEIVEWTWVSSSSPPPQDPARG